MSTKTIIGRRELFAWVERHTRKRLRDYTDLADGSVVCLLFSLVFAKCRIRPVAAQTHSHSQRAHMNWSNFNKGMRLLGVPRRLVERAKIDPLGAAAAMGVTSAMPPHQHQRPFHATPQDEQHCFCSIALFYFLFNVGRVPGFTAEFQVDLTDDVADYLQSLESIRALVMGGGMDISAVPEPLRTSILKSVNEGSILIGSDSDGSASPSTGPSSRASSSSSSASARQQQQQGAEVSAPSNNSGSDGRDPHRHGVFSASASQRAERGGPSEDGSSAVDRERARSSSSGSSVSSAVREHNATRHERTRRVLYADSSAEEAEGGGPQHQQQRQPQHHNNNTSTNTHTDASLPSSSYATPPANTSAASSSSQQHYHQQQPAKEIDMSTMDSPAPPPRLSPSKGKTPPSTNTAADEGRGRSSRDPSADGAASRRVHWASDGHQTPRDPAPSQPSSSPSTTTTVPSSTSSASTATTRAVAGPNAAAIAAAEAIASEERVMRLAAEDELKRLKALLAAEQSLRLRQAEEGAASLRSAEVREEGLSRQVALLREESAAAKAAAKAMSDKFDGVSVERDRAVAEASAAHKELGALQASSSASPAPRGPHCAAGAGASNNAASSSSRARSHSSAPLPPPRAPSEYNDLRRGLIGSELPSVAILEEGGGGQRHSRSQQGQTAGETDGDALAAALPSPMIEAMSNATGERFVFDPIATATALGEWIDAHAPTSSSLSSSSSPSRSPSSLSPSSPHLAKDRVWLLVSAFRTLQSRLSSAKATFEGLVADRSELLALVKAQQVDLDAAEAEGREFATAAAAAEAAAADAEEKGAALIASSAERLAKATAHHRAELLKVYERLTAADEEAHRLSARDAQWKLLCAALRRLRTAASDEEADAWEAHAAAAVERLTALEAPSQHSSARRSGSQQRGGSGADRVGADGDGAHHDDATSSPTVAATAHARQLADELAATEQRAIALEASVAALEQKAAAAERAARREADVREGSVAAAKEAEAAHHATCEALRDKVSSLLHENCLLEMRARQASQELDEVRDIWTESMAPIRSESRRAASVPLHSQQRPMGYDRGDGGASSTYSEPRRYPNSAAGHSNTYASSPSPLPTRGAAVAWQRSSAAIPHQQQQQHPSHYNSLPLGRSSSSPTRGGGAYTPATHAYPPLSVGAARSSSIPAAFASDEATKRAWAGGSVSPPPAAAEGGGGSGGGNSVYRPPPPLSPAVERRDQTFGDHRQRGAVFGGGRAQQQQPQRSPKHSYRDFEAEGEEGVAAAQTDRDLHASYEGDGSTAVSGGTFRLRSPSPQQRHDYHSPRHAHPLTLQSRGHGAGGIGAASHTTVSMMMAGDAFRNPSDEGGGASASVSPSFVVSAANAAKGGSSWPHAGDEATNSSSAPRSSGSRMGSYGHPSTASNGGGSALGGSNSTLGSPHASAAAAYGSYGYARKEEAMQTSRHSYPSVAVPAEGGTRPSAAAPSAFLTKGFSPRQQRANSAGRGGAATTHPSSTADYDANSPAAARRLSSLY